MAQSQLDKAIARRLQRDRENFGSSPAAQPTQAPGAKNPAESFAADFAERPDDRARLLDIERVHPNPEQARTEFAPEAIAELAASLQRDGQLQPILVRPRAASTSASTWGDGRRGIEGIERQEFEIVMGERRWRAARSIGLRQIRATVRDIDDAEMLRLSLVENIQREDLNAVDRARTLLKLKQSSPGLRWHDIAADLGLSRQSINNLVALLRLPQDIQDDIRAGNITEKHGRALRQLGGDEQKSLSQRIRDSRISGDQALASVRDLKARASTKASGTASGTSTLQPLVDRLESARATLPELIGQGADKSTLRRELQSAREHLDAMQEILRAAED